MIKITIKNGSFEWIKDATSFENGINIAQDLHNRLGLIGRTYISSSCGAQTWIR